MNIAEIWAEIETEQSWRLDEIRFFQNQLASIATEDKRDQYRRGLVLLLYAHFEGFCKFTLMLYVDTVNKEEIICKDANQAIAAAALSDLFQALRDPNSKCPEFRTALPEDTQLHRFARDREFVLHSDDFAQRKVVIPDNYVDTESNLKPIVLRKNLYRLGFSHDMFKHLEGSIHRLLNLRNSIAHGESKQGVPEDQYNQIFGAATIIMNEIKRSIMQAIQNKSYLKSPLD